MKKIIQILLILVTCALPQFRREGTNTQIEITQVFEKKRRKRQRKETRKQKILRPKKLVQHSCYISSHPKDHRFSDQRKLRRMFRNS